MDVVDPGATAMAIILRAGQAGIMVATITEDIIQEARMEILTIRQDIAPHIAKEDPLSLMRISPNQGTL